MKKWTVFLLILALVMPVFSGCGSCDHDWKNATCKDPVTCSKCGETAGDKLGHDWEEATCEKPKTCRRCGKTQGDVLGHTPSDDGTACLVCGKDPQESGDGPGNIQQPVDPPTVEYALMINDHEVSLAEFNYYYIDAIQNLYQQYNAYGEYADMILLMVLNLDPSKPLGEQVKDPQTGVTWADWFADQAMQNAKMNYGMYDLAAEDGFTLSAELQEKLEQVKSNVELYASYFGYKNSQDYLMAVYGEQATMESFMDYNTKAYIASGYAQSYLDNLQFTDDQLRRQEADRYYAFCSYSFAIYSIPAGETAQEDLQTLLACDGTLDGMNATISYLGCYDGTTSVVYTDTLYTETYTLQEDLRAWIASGDRVPGDMAGFDYTSADGGCYYAVLFLGRNDNIMYPGNVRHLLILDEGDREQAKQQAQQILGLYLAGDCTEESFVELIRLYSEDVDGEGNPHNDGLYTDISPNSNFVKPFKDWAIADHEPGDVGIIETEYGYHLMYYVGDSPRTYRDTLIAEEMTQTTFESWTQKILDQASLVEGDLSGVNTDYIISPNS